MIKNWFIIVIALMLFVQPIRAQRFVSLPFSGYNDESTLRIGFQYNYVNQNYQLTLKDSWKDIYKNLDIDEEALTYLGEIKSIHSNSGSGLSIGLPIDYRLNDKLVINVTPSFNILNQYRIQYAGMDSSKENIIRKSKHVLEDLRGDDFNSFEFPLGLKLMSEKKNVFKSDTHYRGYIIGGVRYSQWTGHNKYYENLEIEKANDKIIPETIILKPNYISWEAGVGFDIYLSYFKVSPELRFSQSFSSVLNTNHTLSVENKFMAPIDRGLIRNIYFSLIFQ